MNETLGNYQLIEKLAEGGFGEVWKGRRKDMEKVTFSLKIFKNSRDPSQLKKEMEALFSLNHPGVVRVYDAQVERAPYFLVLELCEGRTLREILREKKKLTFEEGLGYGLHLIEALAYLHSQGIIHGDIKPENLMVNGEGKVKIIDFGLAQWYEPEMLKMSLSQTVEVQGGTFYYLAPEVTENCRTLPQSDVFSCGVVLYEMMTGFAYPLYEQLNPPWYEDLVYRALCRKPEERFEDSGEMFQEFQKALEKAPLKVSVPQFFKGPSGVPERVEDTVVEKSLVLAQRALEEGDWEKARKTAQMALSVDPLSEEARKTLQKARLHLGEGWKEQGYLSLGDGQEIRQMAFSEGGDWLALGTQSRIYLVKVSQREVVHTFSSRGHSLEDLVFSGKNLIGASQGIGRWDIEKMRRDRSLSPEESFSSLAVFPHQQWLASSTRQGKIEIWNLREWEKLFVLEGASSREDKSLTVWRISPGKTLLSVGKDTGEAELWEVPTSRRIEVVARSRRDTSPISALAFSFQEDLLALGYRNGVVGFVGMESSNGP